jgi:hypothetical protein
MRSALLLSAAVACSEPPLDTTRSIPDRGTLGEEIFRLFHRDFEREDSRRADGFMLAKDPFVSAIDHLFPPPELGHTQDFLVGLLPLYDDATLPLVTERLSGTFERLALDPQALDSMSALMHRTGYVDLAHEEALIRRIAGHPKYRDLIEAAIELLLAHDGLDGSGGLDPTESDALRRLQAALAEDLASIEITEDDQRGIVLLADLLLSEDPRLSEGPASPSIVARDARGIARIGTSGGAIPPPFVDTDADGLADVDALGRFVDASGRPIDVPPYGAAGVRDASGRALAATGAPLYAYVDLERTILAGLLRDGRSLADRDVPMKAVRSLDAILGDRTPEGTYPAESPIHDLLHAAGQTANLRELPDVLELVRVLLEDHEATTGWVLLETEAQLDVADRHAVALQPGSTFFDDLMGWIRKVLREPGLAEAIIEALEDPTFDDLEESTVRMMRHRKARVTEDDVANGTVFTVPVNRADPDVRGNQSLHQRLLHLMYDTKGAEYEPELIGIPLGFIFRIEDLAEFYILSIIGEAEVPALVSTLTGLSQRPTPEELARFINQDQTFGNPIGHEGIEVKENDGDTLFAATESGLIDVLRPLIQIFHDRGQLRLIFELFEILHLHWASVEGRDFQAQDASAPRYSKLSGIARYEPLLIETFEEVRVLDSVRRLLVETKPLRLASGRPGRDVLLALVRKILEKDGDLRNRDGDRQVIMDGQRITPLSPFDLLRASFSDLDRVTRRDPTLDREWSEVKDALTETFFDIERTGPESGALAHRRSVPILLAVLSFAEDRARRHPNDAALSAWITGDAFRPIEDGLASKELPALIDLLYAIEADERFANATADLADELVDEQRGFGDLLVVLGDGLEASKDASVAAGFLRFLGRELDPSNDLLFRTATLTTRSLELDSEKFLLEVIRRGIEPRPDGGLFAYGITSAVRQANRANPVDPGPMSPEDLRRVSVAVAEYLVDDRHGMEKFYTLVRNRKLENREVSE